VLRLNRFIAFNTEYSRREADELIFSGNVSVNGNVVFTPGYDVKEEDTVAVRGKIVKKSEFLYVKFYKPKYFLTSYGDTHGRKNLEEFEFFKKTKLAYSGRLDYDSEGLIIFSMMVVSFIRCKLLNFRLKRNTLFIQTNHLKMNIEKRWKKA